MKEYADPDPQSSLGNWETDRRTAIYARQSRSRAGSFTSCDAQIGICREMAGERRWVVTRIFRDEGQSSESLDRPALRELISAIRNEEVDRLVIYSIDRLTRRLGDLQTLLELFDTHSVELVVITDPSYSSTSAASRLATNIIAAASQFQQELTRERMADSRVALKQRGKRVAGRVPFGYRADPKTKRLLPDPDQQPLVRDFFKLAAEGGRPSDLANVANLNGWKDQDGNTGRWTARRIAALLKNPTYAGLVRNGKSNLPGEHEAIVSRDVFEAVQQQLASRRTREPLPRSGKTDADSFGVALRGLLICGQCDRPMSTSVSHRGPVRYVYYRCRSTAGGRKPCPGVNVGAYELERFVCGVLADVDDAESVIPLELRRRWNGLDELGQSRSLRGVIQRVVYSHAVRTISIVVRDDWRTVITDEPE
jgi:DNA invertase Pin-like site-specific DNA recombinase